jgi:23S rRNA (guanosine2251-2'-O)-methyltransferase
MHIWDDVHGYKKIPYSRYAYKLDSNGQSKTLYGQPVKKVKRWSKGDEEKGLGTDTRKLCDTLFKIPMVSGGVGSLNVSVAAGVSLYEIVRQR